MLLRTANVTVITTTAKVKIGKIIMFIFQVVNYTYSVSFLKFLLTVEKWFFGLHHLEYVLFYGTKLQQMGSKKEPVFPESCLKYTRESGKGLP